jgi:MFS family permease
MINHFRGLWKNPDFLKLWSAKTISWLGSHVSFLAVPMTAVLLLEATPFQMGFLIAAETVPYLLFSLFIGTWVDRLKRRPLLVMADLGRGLFAFGIPLLALFNGLSIEALILLAFLIGILTVVADVAEEAYFPVLIGREQLIEGHSKLSATSSAMEMIGPGIAGILVQWVSAPIAIAYNALSFLISGVLLMLIQTKEPPPILSEDRVGIWAEMRDGILFTFRHNILRPIIATSVTLQLFGGMIDALLMLYITRDLGLPPIFVGLIFVMGSLTGLIAAALAERLIEHRGVGSVTIISAAMIGVGWLMIPSAGAMLATPMIPILMGMLVTGAGNTLFNITSRSLTQTLTPDQMLGRVNSSSLFLGMGALPVGALVGGVLATELSVQTTLLVAGFGLMFGWFWVFFSPLRRMRLQPVSYD